MRALEPVAARFSRSGFVALDGYVDGRRREAYFSRPFLRPMRRGSSLKIWQVTCVGSRVDTSLGCIDRVTKKSSNELLKSLITMSSKT
jgi:hypothetical protein